MYFYIITISKIPTIITYAAIMILVRTIMKGYQDAVLHSSLDYTYSL